MLLHDVNCRIKAGDRVGLIGKNGAGKTTVLKMLLGQEQPSEGSVDLTPGLRIGYFSQFSELDGTASVRDVLEEVFTGVRTMEAELDEIARALCNSTDDNTLNALLHRQSDLFEAITHCDGWNYQQRIDTVLNKLGFSELLQTRSIEQLSGGWRNRASLAKIMLEEPDILLLDEPTNFLDVQGIAWLESWVSRFRGALIIVSHDRQFIDSVTTRIIEIENYRFQEYSGNFSEYLREKQRRFKILERQFLHEEELLAIEVEAIDERNEAQRNPSLVLKRRLANIKKMAAPRPVDEIISHLYGDLHIGTRLCRVEKLAKAYDQHTLFHDVSFEVTKDDRIAIIGANGSGKSTLLRLLTGEEAPDSGRVIWNAGVEFCYFNQVLEELDLQDTVTHAVNIVKLAFLAPRKQVNKFLALMQFSELDLTQRIGTLSGGQRARVALAKCLLSGVSALILDEPTNHLDLTSTQVMERALFHFPGAVIVVSHDRFFIDKIATRLLIFEENGNISDIAGNWTIWQAQQAAAREANLNSATKR